jgi:hypothetical protein
MNQSMPVVYAPLQKNWRPGKASISGTALPGRGAKTRAMQTGWEEHRLKNGDRVLLARSA